MYKNCQLLETPLHRVYSVMSLLSTASARNTTAPLYLFTTHYVEIEVIRGEIRRPGEINHSFVML